MRSSYDIIENNNYVILNSLQNFYFGEYSIFVYQVGLKHAEPKTGKILKTIIILMTKFLYFNWDIVKSFIFTKK